MANTVEITATIAKTTVDAKKAQVVLELAPSSFHKLPQLAGITGQICTVVIEQTQQSFDFD